MKIIKIALIAIAINNGIIGAGYAASTNDTDFSFHICFYNQSPLDGQQADARLVPINVCYNSDSLPASFPTVFIHDGVYSIQEWQKYVKPSVPLTHPLEIAIYPDNSMPRMAGLPLLVNADISLYMPADNKMFNVIVPQVYRLLTQNNISNRSAPLNADMAVTFNSSYVLETYWMDDQPELRDTANATPPAPHKADMVSIFLHEMGHSLGIASSRDIDTGDATFGGNNVSFFDTFTGEHSSLDNQGNQYGDFWNAVNPGTSATQAAPEIFFWGQHTQAYLGSQGITKALPLFAVPTSMPISSQNFSHVGVYIAEHSDPTFEDPSTLIDDCVNPTYRQENVVMSDIMSGCPVPLSDQTLGFKNSGRMYIQTLDLMILLDLGYAINFSALSK